MTFWSPGGQKLGTYALTATPGTYSNGQFVGPFFYGTQTDANYYFGSKLIKNSRGWVYSNRLGSIGQYLPYGQDNSSGNPTNGSEKFTGYQRDAETGNDYASQRYLSPGSGRFLTPDRKSTASRLSEPNSWNRFAYVGGDPINRIDRHGTDYEQCDEDGNCETVYEIGYSIDDVFAYATELNEADADPNSPCYGEGTDVDGACAAWVMNVIQTQPEIYMAGPPVLGIPGIQGLATPRQQRDFSKAAKDALARLMQNNNCASTFGPDASKVIDAFEDANYVYGFPTVNGTVGGSNVYAATNPATQTVTINGAGHFWSLHSGGQDFTMNTGLGDTDFRAFILLHELAHLTGALGNDTTNQGPGTPAAQMNAAILNNCFGIKNWQPAAQ